MFVLFLRIIVDSFYGKADLEQWLKPDILRTDYSDIISVSIIIKNDFPLKKKVKSVKLAKQYNVPCDFETSKTYEYHLLEFFGKFLAKLYTNLCGPM